MSVDVQIASECRLLPSIEQFTQWVKLATKDRAGAKVVVRLVDEAESAQLNEMYRQKTGATNVLSFLFEMPQELPADAVVDDILGDLVICAPVVAKEAAQQEKEPPSHWAHMVIHGCLHLQGYDHIDAEEAVVMESIEIGMLKSIGIDNPYEG